jgi:predicted DNA repair protein MutK
MATSLLALIDDITTVLDDVALLSKMAAKKTSGVLGDDLALNAQQVSGVTADRELPVVWGVFKGSMVNKAILVPAALAISAWAPWAVTPLLMVGGAYLCFEGVEKLAHKWLHGDEPDADEKALEDALKKPGTDIAALEKDKIKGAIRTDFILSAEIIAITLNTVANEAFLSRLLVLSIVAVLMTVGVYGLVAGIVKLDDAGLWLKRQAAAWKQSLGRGLLALAPWLMKTLSVLGTAAMFLVGGGILTHGSATLHHGIEQVLGTLGVSGLVLSTLQLVADVLVGVVVGAVVLAGVSLVQKLRKR